jgi:hypothetical protein
MVGGKKFDTTLEGLQNYDKPEVLASHTLPLLRAHYNVADLNRVDKVYTDRLSAKK